MAPHQPTRAAEQTSRQAVNLARNFVVIKQLLQNVSMKMNQQILTKKTFSPALLTSRSCLGFHGGVQRRSLTRCHRLIHTQGPSILLWVASFLLVCCVFSGLTRTLVSAFLFFKSLATSSFSLCSLAPLIFWVISNPAPTYLSTPQDIYMSSSSTKRCPREAGCLALVIHHQI